MSVVESNHTPDHCRRRFTMNGFRVMTACLVFPLTDMLTGCASEKSEAVPRTLVLPLAEIPLGGRVRLENNGFPVEIVHTDEGIIARSLLCTHQGCRVRWFEDQQLYVCPCHEGKFDVHGEVVYGMPNAALRRLDVTIVEDQVIVPG